MPTIRLTTYPKQSEFVFCGERFTAMIGGIGSGKSRGGAIKAASWLNGWGNRPSVGLVIAPTYRMLEDATLRTYREVLGIQDRAFNKSSMIARVGRCEIMFRSADNPEHLRGPNIHWAHIDEGALCTAETWPIVIGRLRADATAGPCWVTSTPKGRNWLYDRRGEMRVFRVRTDENPYLSHEYVASLWRSYTEQFARQELEGEFVAFEGLVYSEFSRDTHVCERPGPWRRVILGMDEGYTNPAVILAIGEDGDGRAHVLDEFYQRQVLQADVIKEAQRMAQQYQASAIYCDPSAAGLIAEMQNVGLPAYSGANNVNQGIQAVKARLRVAGDGRARLTVAARCANLISECESYVWRKGGTREEPEKANDHAMDALRYGVMGMSDGEATEVENTLW